MATAGYFMQYFVLFSNAQKAGASTLEEGASPHFVAECGNGGVLSCTAYTYVRLEHSFLEQNNCGADGGVIYSAAITLAVESSTIAGNVAGNSTFFSNSILSNNTAQDDGGFAFLSKNAVNATFHNCFIQDNAAFSGNGGAVSVRERAVLNISDSILTRNNASITGGGIHCANCTL
ncbi:hypothetical protein CYMTET_36005, partial [Cymbomonas tetramitiformis]